jgi:hypothetical protein
MNTFTNHERTVHHTHLWGWGPPQGPGCYHHLASASPQGFPGCADIHALPPT